MFKQLVLQQNYAELLQLLSLPQSQLAQFRAKIFLLTCWHKRIQSPLIHFQELLKHRHSLWRLQFKLLQLREDLFLFPYPSLLTFLTVEFLLAL